MVQVQRRCPLLGVGVGVEIDAETWRAQSSRRKVETVD